MVQIGSPYTTPPPGQSEIKFFLLLGPPPISKIDAIKKILGWTTCFALFSKCRHQNLEITFCAITSSKAVRVAKLVSIHMFLGVRNSIIPIKKCFCLVENLQIAIQTYFLCIFCVSPWAREGEKVTVHPSPMKV